MKLAYNKVTRTDKAVGMYFRTWLGAVTYVAVVAQQGWKPSKPIEEVTSDLLLVELSKPHAWNS